MKKKLLIIVLLVVVCIFALCIAVSAAEYTVGGDDSDFATVKEAEAVAQSGDTIIIEADISEDVNLTSNKSLEFVLKGNLNGGLRISYATATEVTITIRTEGTGNRTIYFKKSNDYSQGILGGGYGNNLKTKYTLNFVGTKDSKLVLNGESYSHGLVTNAMTSVYTNFTHTEITGFNCKNSTSITCGNTTNIYEGTKIYSNSSTGALFEPSNLNVYGGEIYNNTCSGSYMFNLKNVKMYGGSIHDNYMTSTSAVAFMEFAYANENAYYFYEGKIYNNYMDSTGSPRLIGASKYSSKSLIMESCVGDNYHYSAADSSVVPTVLASNYYNLSYKALEYAVIFKNNDGSVVEAYAKAVGSATYYDKSGAVVTERSVPNGSWADKNYYCEATTPDLTKQGTYYVAVAHTFAGDDHDCTTGDSCTVCPYEIAGLAHNLVESLTYTKYTENGTYICDCKNEGCTVKDKNETTPPIFITSGYAVSEAGSIMQGFAVDRQILGEFTRVNGNIITFGMVAGIKGEAYGTDDGTLFSAVGTPKNKRVAVVDYTNLSYDVMEMVVSGLNIFPETEVYCCLYFTVNEKVYYVNETTEADTTTAVSYAVKFPELIQALVVDDE